MLEEAAWGMGNPNGDAEKNPPGEYPIIAGKWIFNDMAVCQNPGTPVVHIKIAGIYGCSSQ